MDDASRPVGGALPVIALRFGANLAGLALALAVVAAGVFFGNALGPAAERETARAMPAPAAVVTPVPTAAPATAAPATAAPATPTPAPTAAPTPVTPAVVATPYTSDRGSYVALNVRPGTTFAAPLPGTVQIRLYQLIDGDIRLNANDATRPVFPYVTIVGADRRMIYRPGALAKDTELLVEDSATVKVGDPLFKVIASGPSSWSIFYDAGMRSQVLVSLAALPSGRELDPLPLLPLK